MTATSQSVGQWRGVERRLLALNALLCLPAAWLLAQSRGNPGDFFPILLSLGALILAAAVIHVLLCLTRFDGDPLLLPIFLLLLLIGAAYQYPSTGPAPHLPSHTRDCLIGLGLLAAVTVGGRGFKRLSLMFEERVWWKYARDRPYYDSIPFHLALLVMMVGLAILLAFRGIRADGGALIQVPLPFGLHFTPSEPIRLAVAFFLADFLGTHSRALQERRRPLSTVWPLNRLSLEPRTELVILLTTVLLYCLFFYVFRDFGPAAVIVLLTLATLYAATSRLLTPLLLGGTLTLLIAIPTYQDLAFHTLRNRVEMWLNPWSTDFVNGDHQVRILWTIASGGWTGLGVGADRLSRGLPLARNDCAFAGITGMLGMWAGLGVLALYGLLAARGVLAAQRAPTDRLRLLAFSLTFLLTFQAVWIAGAMVRVFPFTGINLPFLSTGLSSMICSSVALGALWNLTRRSVADGSGHFDVTEATEGVLTGIERLSGLLPRLLWLPALGLIWYGCPWLGGDRTLTRTARSIDRRRRPYDSVNPFVERFRRSIRRGAILGADGFPIAESAAGTGRGAPVRRYPLGEAGAAFVGWAAEREFMGMPGSVESEWDAVLRGYAWRALPFYFRSRHNPLVARPQPRDLVTTLDPRLQKAAHRILARAVQSAGAVGGAAVVFDVSNGEVLCAVSLPTLDPSDLTLGRMEAAVEASPRTGVLVNKALSREAQYFPGSTFKLLTAAAALQAAQDGAAPSATITCRNGRNADLVTWDHRSRRYRREPGRVSDFSRGGHGPLHLEVNLPDALATSCNVFFAQLGAHLGVERMQAVIKAAGLAWQPSPEDLGEHLAESAFGQVEVKCSPIELAMLAAAAGAATPDGPEKGTARPHWVRGVIEDGRLKPPAAGRSGAPDARPYRPFDPAVAARLRELMVGVVDRPDGTAHAAFYRDGYPRLPGIVVGGKTGTAEFERGGPDSRRSRGRHAWFTGFGRSDQVSPPRTVAFTVFLEDVRPGVTGGGGAAPVARELLAEILPQASPSPPEPALEPSPRGRGFFDRLGSWLRGLMGGRR